ncbi:metalloregulator ArsR/SmtB family transcription factor [Thalassomonas sp. M1454]|uniref:metalloregulator ArsR/SmtB family transcription factor n=1 Tax=Thalassomonas sp. M1454 TaxID=2594477 RepID=UPI00117D95FE|nr:metalloregulator ArsR/SmtB family transcription factor [Thalassomonas sp. M1454]TRX57315.1 metalloregulator ArsR/SmtB family transcription factor [Thalassomonas sp. M1454]
MDPTQFFKCLADDTRLKTLMLIELESELCVCELTSALSVSQPKISRHLALLKKAGVLTDRKHRQWVYYQINPNLPSWAKSIITTSTDENKEFLENNINLLQQMGERPERVKACCN